jgi:hypothetical protein
MSILSSRSIRVDSWDRRLEEIASAQISVLPEWGNSDCLLSTSQAIEAVVGFDPLKKFRGKYTTEAGAAKAMRRNKCQNVKDVFETYLGLEPVNRFAARRGDVGVTLINEEFVAGYICFHGFAVKQPQGTIFLPLDQIHQAYKVGA